MRPRFALAATFVGSLLAASALAQAVPSAPDAIVSVRQDQVGADLVTVTVGKASYPPELLKKQLIDLGDRLGRGGARGVTVGAVNFHPGDPNAKLLKGTCGVDGLIDRSKGLLDVAPIAQAFAGAPEPYTVRHLLVSFDGEQPMPGKTMAYHTAGKGSDLAFMGRPVGSSVEYEVELRSQDPSRLIVNGIDTGSSAPARKASGPDPLTVALSAVAIAAAGALVYCLLLLVGRRPSSKS